MKINKNQFPKRMVLSIILVGLVIFSFYSNCGPTIDNSGPSASGSIPQDSPIPSTSGLDSSCTHDVLNSSRLSVRGMAIPSVPGGFYIKFDRFPSDFNRSTQSMAVWTYTVDAQGVRSEGGKASFLFQKYDNGIFGDTTPAETLYDAVDYGKLVEVMNFFGIPATTPVQDMWGVIVLKILSKGTADSLATVSLYDKVSGSSSLTITDQVSFLIPPFDVNPNAYKSNHPSLLYNLHPLMFMASGAWTDAQFLSESQKYCF